MVWIPHDPTDHTAALWTYRAVPKTAPW